MLTPPSPLPVQPLWLLVSSYPMITPPKASPGPPCNQKRGSRGKHLLAPLRGVACRPPCWSTWITLRRLKWKASVIASLWAQASPAVPHCPAVPLRRKLSCASILVPPPTCSSECPSHRNEILLQNNGHVGLTGLYASLPEYVNSHAAHNPPTTLPTDLTALGAFSNAL